MQNLLPTASPPRGHGLGIDGRIEYRLKELGLNRWTVPIQVWQGRFEGLDKWLSDAHRPPVVAILGLLGKYHRERLSPRNEQIAMDLAQLDFVYAHASWSRWVTQTISIKWQPLECDFSDFEQRFASPHVPQVWVSDKPSMEPNLAVDYLLQLVSPQL